MNDRLRAVGAGLWLWAVCAAVSAQTCRNDIASTAPDSRFTDRGDGTVSDSATGLMWKQCAEGLSGVGCASGTVTTLNWEEALQRAADAVFAGYTDWRLPNKNELESLVERRCYSPAINARFFPNTPLSSGWVWSSSPYAPYPNDAWEVSFDDGKVYWDRNDFRSRVRLVRGGE